MTTEKVTETTETPVEEKSRFKYHFKQRRIDEMLNDLVKPLPHKYIKKRRQGGKEIDYIPWHKATQLFDYYAPGWSYEIRKTDNFADFLVMIVRVYIHGSDGSIFREASGYEKIDKDTYGDAASTAESMAIRRAFAKFGLAVELYDGDEPAPRAQQQQRNPPPVNRPPAAPPQDTSKAAQVKQSNPKGSNASAPGMANEGQLTYMGQLCQKKGKSEIAVCEKFSLKRTDGTSAEVFDQLRFDEAASAITWLEQST